ncbi:MAG: hypothetical protein IKO28_05285 [Prevotella sp.]|nr:hypothetical protein [Prevotella sp.]
MSIVSIITLLIVAAIIYAFRDLLLAIAGFILSFVIIGAVIGWIFFGDGSAGANVGFWIAVVVGVWHIITSLDWDLSTYFRTAYYIISIPVWALNRLQYVLTEPWRYFFKSHWVSDSTAETLRPLFYVMQLLLYIITTPLRLLNAFIYNILIYIPTELYDLLWEAFVPSAYVRWVGKWSDWFMEMPMRIVKYPIYHGFLVMVEGVAWTVIDTIIPAITMYHGTDLTAGDAITRKETYQWNQGTFTASQNSWAGIGVYFAISRTVARRYAEDPHRLSDGEPVMIVCRVSLGKILNYSLAPYSVYRHAGQFGNSAVLNRYAEQNGYDTGEWWNEGGGYWEYCMFDWQNCYNHPWRIRPVFVFNFRTGRAQHIKSGMRHWLFSQVVIDDIMNSI